MNPLHRPAGRNIGHGLKPGPEGDREREKAHAACKTRKVMLARLKQRLAGLKAGHDAPGHAGNAPTGNPSGGNRAQAPGLGAIDACFNAGGLPMAAVHEIWTDNSLERASACGFAIALGGHLARAQAHVHIGRAHLGGVRADGDLVWIYPRRSAQEWGLPYGPGLMAFGHDPGRLILVEVRSAIEALWAGEEALRAASPSAVIIALDETYGAHAFTASRRLELAARARMTSAFVLCSGTQAPASAASLRWRIVPAPGKTPVMAEGLDARPAPVRAFPAHLRWRVTLERNRLGRSGTWIVEWNHEQATLASFEPASRSDAGAMDGALVGRKGTQGAGGELRTHQPFSRTVPALRGRLSA